MKKMNTKTILAWILTLTMAASMTGCGNTSETSDNTADTRAATKAETAAKADTTDDAPAAAETGKGRSGMAAAADGDDADFGGDVMYEAEAVDGGAVFAGERSASMKKSGATADTGAGATADAAKGAEYDETVIPEDIVIDEPIDIEPYDPGQAFILTAGQWNDNANWGFFRNLVDNGTINFPAYGVDPRNRIEVKVVDSGDSPAANEKVELKDNDGNVIWTSMTDKNGVAYVFYAEGQTPKEIVSGGKTVAATATIDEAPAPEAEPADESDPQARRKAGGEEPLTSTTINLDGAAAEKFSKTQVMFILDTTGSMGDEIAYLQKDFSSIAEEVAGDNVTFSMNFYRDQGDDYVTKCNGFTNDVKELQTQLNAERADGGGDWEEAVADILKETMVDGNWAADSNKIAFLIFDAPPHPGTEDTVVTAVKAASEKGIHLVPVIASNSGRETELFGRAVSICTNSNYVFITDDSGVGGSHLEPIIGDYDVELLHDIIVRNINELA